MSERSFFYRYCIIIPETYPKLTEYFENILKENDFDIQSFTEKKQKYICLSQKNEEKMLKEAENLKIKKIIPDTEEKIAENKRLELDKEIIEAEKQHYFKFEKKDQFLPQKIYYDFYSIDPKNKENNNRYGLGLFTESEMLFIEKSILENIPIPDINYFSELIKQEVKENNSLNDLILKEVTFLQKNIKSLVDENSLFTTLERYRVIVDSFPLHVSNFAETTNLKTLSLITRSSLVRCYFNDEVALYFAWTYHYTKFIIIPAFLSLIIFIISKFLSKEKEKMLYIFYALNVTIWVQFFIIFWNRKENSLKIKWSNDNNKYKIANLRKEFQGEFTKSIITGKYELQYSFQKRSIRYFISGVVSFTFISIAVYINIISLNLRGLIHKNSYNFLNYPNYRKYSEKGRIFEKNSNFAMVICPVKNIFLTILGIIYDKINILLTDLENHKYKSNYNNSYILKKFSFESINYFFDIFYLSFILNDLLETSKTIKSFLFMNEIMRITSETLIPYLKTALFVGSIKSQQNEKKLILGEPINKQEVIKQANLTKYNSYIDYYTLIQEFCFLTLFASTVPLTPILLLFTNSLEIRSDITKICLVTRKPEFNKVKSIGTWKYIIEAIAIESIFINIMFCYMYSNENIKTKFSLFAFNFYEHFVVMVIIAIRFFYPVKDKWVRLYELRKALRKKKKQEKM